MRIIAGRKRLKTKEYKEEVNSYPLSFLSCSPPRISASVSDRFEQTRNFTIPARLPDMKKYDQTSWEARSSPDYLQLILLSVHHTRQLHQLLPGSLGKQDGASSRQRQGGKGVGKEEVKGTA